MEARRALDMVAESLDVGPVTTTLLYGQPDQALADFARRAGIELIVIGPKGRGVSEVIYGSVAARLARGCETPIFVGPSTGTSGRNQR